MNNYNKQKYLFEEKRIRETYHERDLLGKRGSDRWINADVLYMEHRKAYIWSQAFQFANFRSLKNIEILDVGCGNGSWLRMLLQWNADPKKLHGTDLLEGRIDEAKKLSPPSLDFQLNSGWPLPYADNSMDLCSASTVLSSILDTNALESICKEMIRVVRTSGWIMIFDFAISKPTNKNTRGISKRKINILFRDINLLKTYRLILAPQLLRLLPKNMLWVSYAIEIIFPMLCTHRLYVLGK